MALFAKNVDDDKRPSLYKLSYIAKNVGGVMVVEFTDIYHNKTKLDAKVRELLKTSKQRGCSSAWAITTPLFRDKETGMCLPAPFEPETSSGFGPK